jgi:hypothetical protein
MINYIVTENNFKKDYKLVYNLPVTLNLKCLKDRNYQFDISKLKYLGNAIIDTRINIERIYVSYIRLFQKSVNIKYMEYLEFEEFSSNYEIYIIGKMRIVDNKLFISV